MLIELTPNIEEIERRKIVAKEHNFEYIPQSDNGWIVETGIYQSSCPHNFPEEEFIDDLEHHNYNEKILYNKNKLERETLLQYYYRTYNDWIDMFGVADNIKQIKQFYQKQIEDKENKFVIVVTPVYQDKKNKGRGGGWRWHKWGKYIGDLYPKHEYLDDEDFGDDFEYVLCFDLYYVS